MSRKLSTVLVLAMVWVVGACNGDDGDAAGTTTEATTSTSSTTTTTMPTTTTAAVAGPEPWNAIVADIYERDWALATSPDPNAVSSLYSEDCDCYAAFLQGTQGLVANGHHYAGAAPRPLAVMATGQGGGGFQRVIVRAEIGPRQVVDAAGNVVQEFAAQGEVCESLLLQPSGPGGTYRIHDVFQPEGCPEGL